MLMASSGVAAQSLKEHSLQSLPKDLPFLAEIKFLLAAHDIGKADERFQRKLSGETVDYNHADGSYEFLSTKFGDSVLNWLIRSHHNADGVQFEFFKEQAVSIPKSFVNDIGLKTLKDKLPKNKVYTPAEILFLFSCLKYFDRSDRYYHINSAERPLLQTPLSLAKLENFRNSLKKGAREEVYNELWAAVGKFQWGDKKTCFIKSPTGSGKTLSALRLALKDNIKKLVYVAPFLSITAQVSDQLKKIFGDGQVVDFTSLSQDEKCEDLDSGFLEYSFTKPVTVITAYKFVEGMFFSLPITYGYLNSTVIIDEWDSFSSDYKALAQRQIKLLNDIEIKVIIISATIGDNEADILVKDQNPPTIITTKANDLSKIAIKDKTLIIINRKADCKKAFKSLSDKYGKLGFALIYHSGDLCSRHKIDNFKRIKNILSAPNGKIIVIGTLGLQRGMDASFEMVVREQTDISSMIQSKGRCNRGGEYKEGYFVEYDGRFMNEIDDSIAYRIEPISVYNPYTKSRVDCHSVVEMFDNYGFREIIAEQPKEHRYLVEYEGNLENCYSQELLKGTGQKETEFPLLHTIRYLA